jgi:hypothetical protein
VEFEDVHTLIDMYPLIQVLKKGANNGGDETYDSCKPWLNVASCWSNPDLACNSTFTFPYNTKSPAMLEVIDHHPPYGTRRCGGYNELELCFL